MSLQNGSVEDFRKSCMLTLNCIDTNEATIMGVVHTIKPTSNK